MESSFNFKYSSYEGNCNVVFSFRDYLTRNEKAEFEINISNFNVNNSSELTVKQKSELKNKLLDLFEKRKNETYRNFIEYLKNKS